jgi:hypothetical protein
MKLIDDTRIDAFLVVGHEDDCGESLDLMETPDSAPL